ncbi:hypothetical protein F53441_14466 [Fusarium austroafricanum]|uniref:Uncharacterized protein n=1 Tax=Fusarium austroafricanum TaxID=2364996 RepID=A0A8H4JE19_9HYPO|nr:hypothetical protein F53441_14466 [Fusarium austroafricanum]
MTSYHLFYLPPSLSPRPEFTRPQSHARTSSHHQMSERQCPSSSHRNQEEPIERSGSSRHRHLADIPRGVERIRDADARLRGQVPRSSSSYPLTELDLCSYRVHSSPSGVDSEYDLSQMLPRKRHRVSNENAVDPSLEYRQPSHPASDGLAHTGSWCHSVPTDSGNMELEWYDTERDVLSEDWRPKTPMDTRLSTPDLPPLSTDFEFCPCHRPGEHGQDRINEDFYFATRSRMDMQKPIYMWP